MGRGVARLLGPKGVATIYPFERRRGAFFVKGEEEVE